MQAVVSKLRDILASTAIQCRNELEGELSRGHCIRNREDEVKCRTRQHFCWNFMPYIVGTWSNVRQEQALWDSTQRLLRMMHVLVPYLMIESF